MRLFSKNPTFPIILTMRKEIEDEKYSEITYKSPNFSFSEGKYPQEMLDLMTVKAKNQLQIPFPDIKTLENFNVKRVMDEDPIDKEKHYYAVLEHEGEHKRYEILNGIENTSITALCEDFAISVKLAREILDKAEEQEPDHSKQEKTDEPPEKQIDEPNKDPPKDEIKDELENEIE
ncbi:hypothetical protein FACS1894132_13350 [Clostridia bacterium]|nr:hypothetical protein FACS1894132_13350 [Clostridia bacterium]